MQEPGKYFEVGGNIIIVNILFRGALHCNVLLSYGRICPWPKRLVRRGSSPVPESEKEFVTPVT